MSFFFNFISNILRAAPPTWLLFGTPLRLYHFFYTVAIGIPAITTVGYLNRKRLMRKLYKTEQTKTEEVEDSIRNFTSQRQFVSLKSGKVFKVDDVSQQFLILLTTPDNAEQMAQNLSDKLSNYNYKIIAIVDGEVEELSDGMVEYCRLNEDESKASLSKETLYLVSTADRKLLFSGPIDPNDKLLARTLKLRMNKILDIKFTEGFRGNRMAD